MAHVERLKNIDDPRISVYRSLRGKSLERERVFIAEGERVMRALAESDIDVISAVMTEEWFGKLGGRLERRFAGGARIYILEPAEMERIVGFRLHQGLMAACRVPERVPLEQAAGLWPSPHFVVALDGVRDAENVGLIIRSAVAFEADTLIVDGRSTDPYIRRVVRVSIGTVFKLPVVHVGELGPALAALKKRYLSRVIAASPAAGARPLNDADFSGNICIVFGSESDGVSEGVLRRADFAVRIPMSKEIDSINVSSASAIILQRAASDRKTGLRVETGEGYGLRSGA